MDSLPPSLGFFYAIVFVLIVAALPYFAGFVYSEAFFRSFGVPFAEARLSDREILASAFFAIRRVGWGEHLGSSLVYFLVILCLLVAAISLIFLYLGWHMRGRFFQFVLVGFLACSFPVVAISFSRVGIDAARDVASSLPFVMVVDVDGPNSLSDLTAAKEVQLMNFDVDRLLHANDREVFILRRSHAGATPALIRIQKSPNRAIIVLNPWGL